MFRFLWIPASGTLVLCLSLAVPSTASAWEVNCLQRASIGSGGQAKQCTSTQARLQGYWDGEHARLCREGLKAAGLPQERIVGFWNGCRHTDTGRPEVIELPEADGAGVRCFDGGSKDRDERLNDITFTLWPQLGVLPPPPSIRTNLANAKWAKALCELAELPDLAWSMDDFASRFQLPCPKGTVGADCRDYKLNIGPSNSTHFGSQASAMYLHYHRIATSLAARCREEVTLWRVLTPGVEPFFDKGLTHGIECEVLALAFEAVGQHYLQDRWSVGHMWERWGSPSLSDYPSHPKAVAIASIVGLIHGAKALLDPMMADANDPMSAPDPAIEWGFAGSPDRFPGVGDLFVDTLLTDSRYAVQRNWLLGCSAAGFAAVYEAGPQSVGPITGADRARFPLDKCLSPWVTNAAIARSSGLTVGGKDLETGPLAATLGELLMGVGKDEFISAHTSLAIHQLPLIAAADPKGFALAQGDKLPALFGVPPGSAFVKNIPPAYSDVALPWPDRIERSKPMADLISANSFVFAREECRTVDWAVLERLRENCMASHDESTLPEPDSACGRCMQAFHMAVTDLSSPNPRRSDCEQVGASTLTWDKPVCSRNERTCKKPKTCLGGFAIGNIWCNGTIADDWRVVSAEECRAQP